MAKKKIGINTPVGGIEVEWEKELKDRNADAKTIKNIVKSYCISIDNNDTIAKSELDKLLNALRNYGHLSRFENDAEFMNQYRKIIAYLKENYEPSIDLFTIK